jgi:hypothetical protein
MPHKIIIQLALLVFVFAGSEREPTLSSVPTSEYHFIAQAQKTPPSSAALPKPAVGLTSGTWKYKDTDMVRADLTLHSTYSVTVKDDNGTWTITTTFEFPQGPVTDISTLEKGTLFLRKESWTHFLHPDQPWKPVAIDLDFNGNKVAGTMKYVNGPDKTVSVDLGGPLFAGPAGWVGCLPLTNGYSTTFRYFDIDRFALNPQAANKIKLVELKVVGMERVSVAAGTFDSYKVELTSAEGGLNKETIWIAKDSRAPVKAYIVSNLYGVITTELVPLNKTQHLISILLLAFSPSG